MKNHFKSMESITYLIKIKKYTYRKYKKLKETFFETLKYKNYVNLLNH